MIITTRYRSIDTPVGMVEPEELENFVKSLWLDGNSLASSSKIRDTIVIDQKFDYLYRRESGEFVAVVVNSDGSTTETEFDLHKNPSQTLINRRQRRQLGLFTKRTSNGHKRIQSLRRKPCVTQ